MLGSCVVLKVPSSEYQTIIKIYLILTTVDFLVIRNLAGEIAQEYAKRQVWNLSFARVVLTLFCWKCEIDSSCAPYHYNSIMSLKIHAFVFRGHLWRTQFLVFRPFPMCTLSWYQYHESLKLHAFVFMDIYNVLFSWTFMMYYDVFSFIFLSVL